jgi:hypothetical protein
LHRRSEALPNREKRTISGRSGCLALEHKNPMGSTRSAHFVDRQNSMAAWPEFGVADAQAATGRHGYVDAARGKKRSMETEFRHGPRLAIALD